MTDRDIPEINPYTLNQVKLSPEDEEMVKKAAEELHLIGSVHLPPAIVEATVRNLKEYTDAMTVPIEESKRMAVEASKSFVGKFGTVLSLNPQLLDRVSHLVRGAYSGWLEQGNFHPTFWLLVMEKYNVALGEAARDPKRTDDLQGMEAIHKALVQRDIFGKGGTKDDYRVELLRPGGWSPRQDRANWSNDLQKLSDFIEETADSPKYEYAAEQGIVLDRNVAILFRRLKSLTREDLKSSSVRDDFQMAVQLATGYSPRIIL